MKYILPITVFFLVASLQINGQNAICQDVVVQLDSDGMVFLDPNMLDNGSTGTPPLNMFVEPPVLSCENIGPNDVTLFVMDSSGSTDQCSANVTVEDTEQPVVVCNDISDWNVNQVITLTDIGTASDNCSITQTLILPNSFDQPGTYTASLIAFDIGGSATTCVSFVTVVGDGSDNEPPTLTQCPDEYSVELDFSCQYEMEDLTFLVGAEDNMTSSENLVYSQSPAPGEMFTGSSTQTVSVTVTDEAGISSTCNFQLNLFDGTPANIVNCPEDQLELLDETFIVPNYAGSLTAFDNCSDNFDLVISQNYAPGTTLNEIGVYEVIVVADDESGNTAYCSFNLNLFQENDAVAVCQDVDVELNMNGQVAISPEMINAGSVANEPFELMIDVDQFECGEVGANFVTLTVAGDDGNNASCTAVVTVMDNQAPMMICQNVAVNLLESDTVNILTNNLVQFSVDNCGIINTEISQTTFTAEDMGENNVIVTIMDNSGNSASCVSLVTVVEEDLPPTAICADPFEVVLDENGSAIIEASVVDGGSTLRVLPWLL